MAASKSVTDLVGAARVMPGINSAELYSDTAAQVCRRSLDNLFQGKHFLRVNMLTLHYHQIVLDIGCGTGEATSSLAERLSCGTEICAVDRSREFIDYAQDSNMDTDISYQCLNVEEEWPQCWEEKYTMVFSNYVLHWIKDHHKLYASINRSMKKDADLVLQFFHSATMSEETMLAARKAAHDCGIQNEMQAAMMAIRKQLPIWKDMAAYKKLISSLGFQVKTCKVEERRYTCETKFERAGMTVTVSPFMNHVPQDKKLLFATKYVNYLEDPYTIHHKAVVVHAVKVSNC
ncbi:trans-aconitate 2-methyltransferase-like [Watersipora subatra]|uniref:trans-aconitate 2-methyltransferase-like n=1 Tax=Watersipora subatra TaxID=2589382 RepID=UPI00355B7DD2